MTHPRIRNVAAQIVAVLIAALLIPLSIPMSSSATTLASISPATGFNGGGFDANLTGTGFGTTGTPLVVGVSVLGNSGAFADSASFTVTDDSNMTVSIPVIPGEDRFAGALTVRVHFSGSYADETITLEAPAAQSLSVNSGTAAGGNTLEIYGIHFEDPSGASNVVGVSMISSTQSYAASASAVSVTGPTSLSATLPTIADGSRFSGPVDLVVHFSDSTSSSVSYELIRPTLVSATPDVGAAAGGTQVTLTGTGFFDGTGAAAVTELRIGSEAITDFTVVSDTSIIATLSARVGINRTIGSKKFFLETAISASGDVFFDFSPIRDAANDNATDVNGEGNVVLGDLASRTQGKPIVRSGSNPYFVDGTDSLTGLPYRYRTNAPYTHGDPTDEKAYTREGTEREATFWSRGDVTEVTESVGGRTINAIKLVQDSNCRANNGSGNNISYCSVFGPEFYSEAFYATDAQALSFDWYALGNDDDYEIYAYLVSVPDTTTIPTPSAGNHTLVAHGVGYRSGVNFWQTSTANIPADGLYRFRFVNGSYDGTGGYALGSTFYVGSVFTAGARNAIEFGPISDQIGASNATFTTNATSDSGAEVTIQSNTTGICTVATSYSAPNTTVTVTKVNEGTCTLIASQGESDGFATPASEVVSFRILDTAQPATAPSILTVTPDNAKLTFTFTRPAFDGGSPIVAYEYSVVIEGNAPTWVSLSDTVSLRVEVSGLTNGTDYDINVRAITDRSGLSSATASGTPVAIAAPSIAYSEPTQSMTVNAYGSIVNPTNTGGRVAGYTISSGVLPTGLALNTNTGFIVGTPTATGSTTVFVEAFNSGGTSSPTALTIQVINVPPIITYPSATLTLTKGTSGTSTPALTGGPVTTSGNVVFISSGTLPAGLSLDPATGEISGTPTVVNASGTTVKLRARGAENQLSGETTLLIRVLDIPPVIDYASDKVVVVGVSTTINTPISTGGTPVSFTRTPTNTGLNIDFVTGVITGTPNNTNVNQTVSFTITATNSGGSDTATLLVFFAPATPAFTYTQTTSGQAGVAITLNPTGVTATSIANAGVVTYAISPALPSGMQIDPTTGVISGVPLGGIPTTSFTVTATNSIGGTGSFTLALFVGEYAPSLAAYAQATYSFRVGQSINVSAPLNTGGPANWTTSPELPAGLVLNTASGVITGSGTETSAMTQYTMIAENLTGSSSALISIEILPSLENEPTPTYNGPVIQSVEPNVVTVEGGETVVVIGQRLGTAEQLRVGSEPVRILSATNTEIRFVMPTMLSGVYDLLYVYSGGARLTYMDAMTVIPKKVTTADAADATNRPGAVVPNFGTVEQWAKPWKAVAVVNPFAPGKSDLLPHLRAQVRKHVRTYAQFASHIDCIGYTMGPTVLKVDAALSVARAKAVCDYLEELRPRLIVEVVAGKQDLVVADRIRRSEVTFYRPAINLD